MSFELLCRYPIVPAQPLESPRLRSLLSCGAALPVLTFNLGLRYLHLILRRASGTFLSSAVSMALATFLFGVFLSCSDPFLMQYSALHIQCYKRHVLRDPTPFD